MINAELVDEENDIEYSIVDGCTSLFIVVTCIGVLMFLAFIVVKVLYQFGIVSSLLHVH